MSQTVDAIGQSLKFLKVSEYSQRKLNYLYLSAHISNLDNDSLLVASTCIVIFEHRASILNVLPWRKPYLIWCCKVITLDDEVRLQTLDLSSLNIAYFDICGN